MTDLVAWPVLGRAQVFLTENFIGISMEYASGGDLFDYTVKRGGLKEDEARWFFQQLICAVDYMHTKVGAFF
jgi:serine/threonine-protein kinase SRK2